MAVVSPQLTLNIREIISSATGLTVDEVDPTKALTKDLGIDSLSMVDIAVRCEDAFGVRMDDGVMANLATAEDVAEFIASHATRGLPEA
ncbi:acyl carrier protein [Corynebacterium sp. 13CS0277]|uniref:acyl carrier protein n=1 Tax=Corynebacterium sp. 13CS0277 TaxID=2071994 RepID=UPI000D0315D9|nr:acyl carrier protein [Corynebacterium sp. 13CS0277]PRQ10709.1 acyl carrier protein [Corynebacterium sp. 13CS0277]